MNDMSWPGLDYLSDDQAFEDLLEEKKRQIRVKRYAQPILDMRKDYHK